jgi:hypothetical protein
VRQQNQELIRGIQKITSTSNTTNGYNISNPYSSSSSTISPFPISIEDQDEASNNNINSNNNNNPPSPPSQSLTRSGGVPTTDPAESEQPEESPVKKARIKISSPPNATVTHASKERRPLTSSLIGAVRGRSNRHDTDTTTSPPPSNIKSFVNSNSASFSSKDFEERESISSKGDNNGGGSSFLDENEPKNSPTEFKSENSNILLGQISDIDEVEERVRTSIVLR